MNVPFGRLFFFSRDKAAGQRETATARVFGSPGIFYFPSGWWLFLGGEKSRRLRLKKMMMMKKHTAAHPLSFRPHFFYYFLSFPFLSFAGPASTVSTAPPTGGGREIRKGRVTWWARDYYEEEEEEADITRVYIYIYRAGVWCHVIQICAFPTWEPARSLH